MDYGAEYNVPTGHILFGIASERQKERLGTVRFMNSTLYRRRMPTAAGHTSSLSSRCNLLKRSRYSGINIHAQLNETSSGFLCKRRASSSCAPYSDTNSHNVRKKVLKLLKKRNNPGSFIVEGKGKMSGPQSSRNLIKSSQTGSRKILRLRQPSVSKTCTTDPNATVPITIQSLYGKHLPIKGHQIKQIPSIRTKLARLVKDNKDANAAKALSNLEFIIKRPCVNIITRKFYLESFNKRRSTEVEPLSDKTVMKKLRKSVDYPDCHFKVSVKRKRSKVVTLNRTSPQFIPHKL